MLLERIIPGETLVTLKDFNEQLMIAADLISIYKFKSQSIFLGSSLHP
jgi:hypothetical protein